MESENPDQEVEIKHKVDLVKSISEVVSFEGNESKFQDIFLVALGEKRGGYIALYVDTQKRQNGELQIKKVENVLSQLGLFFKTSFSVNSEGERYIDINMAVNKQDFEEIERLTDPGLSWGDIDENRFGELMGYPKSAAQAFVQKDLLGQDDQIAKTIEAGVKPKFTRFRFSRECWGDEIKVIKRWFDLCERYGIKSPD